MKDTDHLELLLRSFYFRPSCRNYTDFATESENAEAGIHCLSRIDLGRDRGGRTPGTPDRAPN